VNQTANLARHSSHALKAICCYLVAVDNNDGRECM